MKAGRKFRRKTLKQWAAFSGRRRIKSYRADHTLHAFEDDVIERKVRDSKRGAVTATELCGLFPDLFNAAHLPRAMKRMASAGLLVRAGRGWKRSPSYRLPVAPNDDEG